MQHILHIVPRLHLGGTATELVMLGRGLSKSDFRQDVCVLAATPSALEALGRGGIEATVIGSRGEFDAVALWRIVRLIQRLKPSILHIWPPVESAHVWMAASLTGFRPLVVTMRSIESCPATTSIHGKWLIERASGVVVSSAAMRGCLISKVTRPDKVMQIRSGVAETRSSPISRQELIAELRLPGDAKLISYVGSLRKENRLKELIWAIDQLKAVGVPAHLLVIGEGPLRQSLERYRWLNRVDDRVHFLGAQLDVSPFLSHCDVLWQAGAYQGHSRAILEAMACGIPVVAADSPGNRELVGHGGTGYLVPLGERAGFARWTLPILEEPGLAANMGATARQIVRQHHRPEAMLENYERMYRDLQPAARTLK